MGLTVANATQDGVAVGVRCEDGLIAAIGPGVGPEPGDELIDAEGMALVGGLTNGHTHAAMTLFRGFADDLPLMEWLTDHIWPVEKRMDEEDVYWGTRLACAEMIRNGITCFWDNYWHPYATARAVEDAGMRAVTAPVMIDDCDPARSESVCSDAQRSVERIVDAGHALARPGLAPHSIYALSERSLRWASERAAELDLSIQIHLSETEGEVTGSLERHGMRPAQYLDQVGMLGPRTVLAHGCWLDRDELALIAERGATVVTNPVANLKLAVGRVFPYRDARELGVELGLGTDGPGSNNSLDLLSDVKAFALLQKNEARDPAAVTATESLAIAGGRRSRLLGGRELAEAEPADFLLVRADDPELSLGALAAGLVYAASGTVVDTTVVAGRPLMRGGRIEGVDEVIARARGRAERLGIG